MESENDKNLHEQKVPEVSSSAVMAGIVAAAESEGHDLRPHYWDPLLKLDLLVDSGSQVTAVPPDPGDLEDKNVVLRAVNGTRIKTFGFKNISIKINRKSYPFKAVKAEVDSPVIGWDFIMS